MIKFYLYIEGEKVIRLLQIKDCNTHYECQCYPEYFGELYESKYEEVDKQTWLNKGIEQGFLNEEDLLPRSNYITI